MRKLNQVLSLMTLTTLLGACQAPNAMPGRAPLNTQRAAQSRVQANASTQRFYDTAKDAFRWAEMDARNWDFSARLAKVEGRMIDESGKSFDWTFYFTAIGKQKALRVSNHQKQEVPNTYFGGGMMDLSWRVDSKAALEKAKEQGLKTYPVSSMELDSFLTWEIRSFDGFYRVSAR